jgi:hypothetical protein
MTLPCRAALSSHLNHPTLLPTPNPLRQRSLNKTSFASTHCHGMEALLSRQQVDTVASISRLSTPIVANIWAVRSRRYGWIHLRSAPTRVNCKNVKASRVPAGSHSHQLFPGAPRSTPPGWSGRSAGHGRSAWRSRARGRGTTPGSPFEFPRCGWCVCWQGPKVVNASHRDGEARLSPVRIGDRLSPTMTLQSEVVDVIFRLGHLAVLCQLRTVIGERVKFVGGDKFPVTRNGPIAIARFFKFF